MATAYVRVKTFYLQGIMEYKNEEVLSYHIEYPQFASDKYKAFIHKLNIYYKADATLYQKFHVAKLYQMAIDDYEYATSNGFLVRKYEIVVKYELTYNQDCVISLFTDRYEYTGGAHGMTNRVGDTWSLEKGKRMLLSDFFPGQIDYKERIIEAIYKQIENQISTSSNYYFDDYENLVRDNFNERNFYIVPEGVTIFYQLYEIAPYSSGIMTFLIPFENSMVKKPNC
ncbi:MAG: DUF3298 and DUF4163 domain-containing protein [Anaerocolumna sp.]